MVDDIETFRRRSPPVSNKRKRTRTACIHCRGRKQKCDGRQPTCSSCLMLDLACSYDIGPRKRGLPTGYVRSLELLWALVFAVVPNGQKIITEVLEDTDFAVDPTGKLVVSGKLACDSEALRHLWINSGVPAELERQLSRLEAEMDTTTFNPEIGRQACLPAALPKSNILQFAPIRAPERERFHEDGSQRGNEVEDVLDDTQTLHASSISRTQPSNLPQLPQDATSLVDIYFTYTHCWLPIIEKHKIFEVLYSDPGASRTGRGDKSTLWAILACSSFQRLQSHNTSPAQPNPDSIDLSPQQIYATARASIPDEDDVTEVGHANALLILALCLLHQHALAAAWKLVGRAVRVALDPEHQLQELGRPLSEEKARTLFGCFVIDTLISSQIGKPPHLRSADIRYLPALLETGPGEWEPWSPQPTAQRANTPYTSPLPSRSISTFNQLISLARILNDIRWHPAEVFPGEVHLGSLQRWINNLPQHCGLTAQHDRLSNKLKATPQLINLQLAFRNVLAILRTAHSCSSNELDHVVENISAMELASLYEKNFQSWATPAIFNCYGMAIKTNTYWHTPSGPALDIPQPCRLSLGQMETIGSRADSSPAVAQSIAEDTSVAFDSNSSVTASEPKRSYLQGFFQDGLDGYLLPETSQNDELSGLAGIEWYVKGFFVTGLHA